MPDYDFDGGSAEKTRRRATSRTALHSGDRDQEQIGRARDEAERSGILGHRPAFILLLCVVCCVCVAIIVVIVIFATRSASPAMAPTPPPMLKRAFETASTLEKIARTIRPKAAPFLAANRSIGIKH